LPSIHLPRRLAAALLATLAACGGGGGGSGHTITLRYESTLTDAQRKAFEDARDRLERIITGGLGDVRVQDGSGNAIPCGDGADAVDVKETVHGLLILVTVKSLGSSGILAQSGPCIVRSSGSELPVVAIMNLNSSYAASLEASGELGVVVQHEMFHALGFGTIWPDKGLLSGAGTDDPSFTGAAALAAATTANGAPSSWTAVKVENTGGAGTRDAHWRESVFGNELMTGWISGVENPLSLTTIESMADLGYSVDAAQAEAFTIPSPDAALRASGAEPRLHLGDDVLHLVPRRVAD
jgi:hypothetical protein